MRALVPVAVALLSLSNASAHADSFPMIGSKVTVNLGFIGCKAQNEEEHVKSLVRAHDMEAVLDYVTDHSSSCHGFGKNEVASVEDMSVWHNTACIRPEGKGHCYWFPNPMVDFK